jgi:hypothetical protein
VIADEQCDVVRQHASGPRSERSLAGLWDSETCALFIRGSNITSRMKERLTQQLLDAYLRAYLEKKELWSAQQFESLDWTNYRSAFKRLSKGWQTAVVKATHNIWHTVTWHQQYFGEAKACYMCNFDTEDWRNVLACGSTDASLHRAGQTQKIDGLTALNSRLLDDNREGCQPLHITTTQKNNTIERELTTKTIRSHIQHTKEPTTASIQEKITHRLGQLP